MKWSLTLLKSILFSLILFSCGGDEGTDTPNNQPPQNNNDKIELAAGTDINPVISEKGDKIAVSFTASTSWSASVINDRADNWCSVSPASGTAGGGAIIITANENSAPDERSASVVIKAGTASQTIKVTQKQKDAITVTQSTFEVEANGAEISIEVKANVDFKYTISENAKNWIEYVSTKAVKTSTLIFSVKKNDDIDKREGEITISNGSITETIKVFQKGETPSIVLNKNEYTVKAEGETFAIDVASNVNVTTRIEHNGDTDNWLEENKSKAMSTNTFYFTAAKNETHNNREAKIIFTNRENALSDTVFVTQLQKDAIVIAKRL